jgi:hypothetical protein
MKNLPKPSRVGPGKRAPAPYTKYAKRPYPYSPELRRRKGDGRNPGDPR